MTNALDRLVAERVMGFPVLLAWVDAMPEVGACCIDAKTRSVHKRYADGLRPWSPSTDPRDTFAVVDQLRAEGWRFSLVEQPDVWSCMFMTVEPTRVDVYKQHKDRLTAILLAALAVRGVSDDEVQAAIKEGA